MSREHVLQAGLDVNCGVFTHPASAVEAEQELRDAANEGKRERETDMTETTADQRVICSTWTTSLETRDAGYADELREAIDARLHDHVRSSQGGSGGDAVAAVVVRYRDTRAGTERWALVYIYAQGTEYIDFTGRADAEAAYETSVTRLAAGAPEQDGPYWDSSDVDGVPTRD